MLDVLSGVSALFLPFFYKTFLPLYTESGLDLLGPASITPLALLRFGPPPQIYDESRVLENPPDARPSLIDCCPRYPSGLLDLGRPHPLKQLGDVQQVRRQKLHRPANIDLKILSLFGCAIHPPCSSEVILLVDGLAEITSHVVIMSEGMVQRHVAITAPPLFRVSLLEKSREPALHDQEAERIFRRTAGIELLQPLKKVEQKILFKVFPLSFVESGIAAEYSGFLSDEVSYLEGNVGIAIGRVHFVVLLAAEKEPVWASSSPMIAIRKRRNGGAARSPMAIPTTASVFRSAR